MVLLDCHRVLARGFIQKVRSRVDVGSCNQTMEVMRKIKHIATLCLLTVVPLHTTKVAVMLLKAQCIHKPRR